MNKTVFYLSNIYVEDDRIGITKKVLQQINAIKNLGFEKIYYTSYYDSYMAVLDQNNVIIFKQKYLFKNKFLKRFLKNYELKIFARKFLENSRESYDFIYLRYIFFDQMFYNLLKTCKKKSKKVIVEAHSYPIYNKRDILYYPVYFIDYLYKKKCSKYIDLVMAISDKKNIWGVKTLQIDNAIEIKEYNISKNIYKSGNDINLIFVGYEYNVHGLDRLIKGLEKYYEKKPQRNVNLFLVGRFSKKTMQYIRKPILKNKIFYFGIQTGIKLDKIFDKADIGIGILAPYRRNSNLGTGLKTKEYMARGLPIVFAGQSLSVNKDSTFFLSIPNNNTYVSIDKIIDFYEEIATKENIHENIRNMAKKFTWEKEFEKMLNIL